MKVRRNDPCPCGSGRKYKKCCLGKVDTNGREGLGRARMDEPSLEKRNLILLEAVTEIFGFARGIKWEEVRRDISGDQIRELYKVVAWLWPPKTDLASLIPPPGRKLRALYLGDVRPEPIVRNVYRFGLYADEIFIVNPFHNPWCLAREYNPLEKPDKFKIDTIKLIFFIGLLEPWIRAGLVTLIPDPGDFEYALRKQTWELARERHKDWKPSREDLEDFEPAAREDFGRVWLTLPKEYLARKIREVTPEISDQLVADTLAYIDRVRREDPLALDQPVEEAGSQVVIMRTGANLEMALYIAHLTGAFPYTNIRHRWSELLSVGRELPDTARVWSPLTRAFQGLEFKFLDNVDSQFACSMRTEGRLESFRVFLRRLWDTVGGEPDAGKIEALARDFQDELIDEYQKAEAEWAQIDRDLLRWTGTSLAGSIAGSVISGGFSVEIPALGFSVAAVVQLINSRMKRKEFRKKIPMSVFVDLSRYKTKNK